MAKHDRCEICDYSEIYGSDIANVLPRENGKVRKHLFHGRPAFLCDSCNHTVYDTILEYGEADEPVE